MVMKTLVTPRVDQSTVKADVVTRVSAQDVSHRAYDLFQARGSEHGHDVEDWLVAETELRTGNGGETKSPSPSLKLHSTRR
jgi:hypothetical protein